MNIISIYFALLTILSGFIYYILKPAHRPLFLALLSFLFIASFSLPLLGYVLLFSVVNYLIGRRLPVAKHKKQLFNWGLTFNILQIVVLRYFDFTINPLLELVGGGLDLSNASRIIAPVGISYFTLQGIGYLVNVKMGWEKPEPSLLKYIVYLVYFPKFISGPIDRSNRFLPQLNDLPGFSSENVITGLRIALFGFFKKVVIANHLSAAVNTLYQSSDLVGGMDVLLVILIQPLYIYFDFSGYTDIAIGFSRVFGINLVPNFNKPFLAENITNFWKRFHMSLSSWFNDYVFMQLSFRLRKLKSHSTIITVFITWILFGIWHGAGWNFMVLGLIQALAIFYEFRTKKFRQRLFSYFSDAQGVFIGRSLTYLFYGFSLIFFFSPDLSTAFNILGRLQNLTFKIGNSVPVSPLLFGLSLALLFWAMEYLQNCKSRLIAAWDNYWNQYRVLRIVTYYLAVIFIISEIGGATSFIYEMF